MFYAVKNGEDVLAAIQILQGDFKKKDLRESFEANPDLEESKVWLDNEIVKITKKEYNAFLKQKEKESEDEITFKAKDLPDRFMKRIVFALAQGKQKAAERILLKAIDKVNPPPEEEPVEEEVPVEEV